MNKEVKLKDAFGNNLVIEPVGCFGIPELNKEYIIYSILHDKVEDKGYIMIGELIKDDDGNYLQVLPILKEEQDLVMCAYSDLKNALLEKDDENE